MTEVTLFSGLDTSGNNPHLTDAFPSLHGPDARLVVRPNHDHAVASLGLNHGSLRHQQSAFGHARDGSDAPEHAGTQDRPRVIERACYTNRSCFDIHLPIRKHDPAFVWIYASIREDQFQCSSTCNASLSFGNCTNSAREL